MQKTHEKVIGSRTFKVMDLPAKEAWDLLIDLTKSFGGSGGTLLDVLFSAYLDAAGGDLKEALLGIAASGNAEKVFQQFANSLDKKMLAAIQAKLADVTLVEEDGVTKPLKGDVAFDAAFRGRIGDMMQWFGFALASQFADFLGTLRAALGK